MHSPLILITCKHNTFQLLSNPHLKGSQSHEYCFLRKSDSDIPNQHHNPHFLCWGQIHYEYSNSVLSISASFDSLIEHRCRFCNFHSQIQLRSPIRWNRSHVDCIFVAFGARRCRLLPRPLGRTSTAHEAHLPPTNGLLDLNLCVGFVWVIEGVELFGWSA